MPGPPFGWEKKQMEAPCDLDGKYDDMIGGFWDCPIEMGFCTICGAWQELPWAAMSHEVYGLSPSLSVRAEALGIV